MDNDNNPDEEENQLIIIDGEKWTVHMDEQTGKHFLFNGIETKWATDEEETFFQRQIIAAIDDHKHIELFCLVVCFYLSFLLVNISMINALLCGFCVLDKEG